MKTGNVALAVSAAALLLASFSLWRARPPASASPPDLEALQKRIEKLEASAPGPGDAMTGTQAHFSKLWFAVQASNWDLAQFEQHEVEEGLDAAAAAREEDNGVDLPGLVEAFKNTQLAAIGEAVKHRDTASFRKAYEEATEMCNSCHQATGRPFIHIVLPTAPPVSNQRWEFPGADRK